MENRFPSALRPWAQPFANLKKQIVCHKFNTLISG
jgi:hypothetical protein